MTQKHVWCAFAATVLASAIGGAACQMQPSEPAAARASTSPGVSTMAVAWKQTAAEYEALYLQGFALARLRVEQALGARAGQDARAQKPLAVISDLDDTILDTRGYWRELLASGGQLFEDARWDAWVARSVATPSPGAVEFLAFCRERGVEVFVITSRDQGERTAEVALANIKAAGLPGISADRLTVLRETSDKETRQQEIAATHDIAVLLGDNLNDFRRRYYVTSVEERRRLMFEDRADFGARFIVFPNPTDGHWIRAIFGDSEPPPTPETLRRLTGAASGAR
jgi:5'-nucleotidase (lipoprotein e(P4) family)